VFLGFAARRFAAVSPPAPEASRASSRGIYAAVALFFALAAVSYLAYQASQVVLTLLVTLLLAVVASAPVDWLARRGLGRGKATALVVGTFGLALWLGWVLVAPAVEQQARQFADALPALLEDAEAVVARSGEILGVEAGADLELENLPGAARELVSEDLLAATAGFGRSVVALLSYAFVAFVATIFLVVRPFPVVDGFVALFPASRRGRVREVLAAVYRTVQRWLLGQLVAMGFIGVSTAAVLWLLGVPFALLLGLFSGLVSFVPFVGAFVSAVPPILLALLSDPVLALWVALAYTAIQQVESQVIQPLVMSRAVALHPAVLLFGLLLMGSLFGIVGLLLAVPLVATVQVLVRELWVRRMDGAGSDPDPPVRESREGPRRWLQKLLRNPSRPRQQGRAR